MKRREFIKISAFAGIALAGCKNVTKNSKHNGRIKNYLESEIGKTVTLEGKIIHVCPIEKQKMKLKLADGEIIRVVYPDYRMFSTDWNDKEVRISGNLENRKIMREEIAFNYKQKKLLCHIDHSPCTDEKWIENRWKDGSAKRLLEKDNNELLLKMRNTKSNFLHVFTLHIDHIEVISIKELYGTIHNFV